MIVDQCSAQSWSRDDPSHSGYIVHGSDTTGGNKAYFVHIEAKEEKEELVAQFLQDISSGINKEPTFLFLKYFLIQKPLCP